MKFFQSDDFEEEYSKILKGENGKWVYIDPDCVGDVSKTNYYNLLTQFLIKQNQEYGCRDYQFLPPRCAGDTLPEEKEMDGEKMDKKKIAFLEKGERKYRLTSDQFGFSAAEDKYDKKKYPLTKLLFYSLGKNEKEQEKTINRIINYVKNTRTLGGAFVWPIPNEGDRRCSYNNRRGISSYIEDRVDLTLLEIKHALEGEYDKDNYTSDILYGVLYDEYRKQNSIMKDWLGRFGSFDNYIRFFMLDAFVSDNVPIDITTGNKIDEHGIQEYKKKFKKDQKGALQKLSEEELNQMLNRVESMILKRTQKMEEKLGIESEGDDQ